MFSNKKNNWIEQLRIKLTDYADERFLDYKGQISEDLSKGLAALAGLVAIWTMAIISVVFIAITLALFFGWVLTFWMDQFAYVLSFLLIATVIAGVAYYILKNRKRYIETPVYQIMSDALSKTESPPKPASKKEEEDWSDLPPLD